MNKLKAQEWANALRSGKYEQCTGSLRDNGKFCCLGVIDEINPSMDLSGDSTGFLDNHKRVGLTTNGGTLKGVEDQVHASLQGLNDIGYIGYNEDYKSGKLIGKTSPLTFDEIADIIEAEYVLEILK